MGGSRDISDMHVSRIHTFWRALFWSDNSYEKPDRSVSSFNTQIFNYFTGFVLTQVRRLQIFHYIGQVAGTGGVHVMSGMLPFNRFWDFVLTQVVTSLFTLCNCFDAHTVCTFQAPVMNY
jgi:hypothetical protein